MIWTRIQAIGGIIQAQRATLVDLALHSFKPLRRLDWSQRWQAATMQSTLVGNVLLIVFPLGAAALHFDRDALTFNGRAEVGAFLLLRFAWAKYFAIRKAGPVFPTAQYANAVL